MICKAPLRTGTIVRWSQALGLRKELPHLEELLSLSLAQGLHIVGGEEAELAATLAYPPALINLATKTPK